MRKLLVLFVVAAVALSVGGAFGDPPEDGNGRGPFENPPCLDEDGNGPDHGHPNENSPKCAGDDNGNGDNGNGCPPAGPVTQILVDVANGAEAEGFPAEGAQLIRDVACAVFDLTTL